MNMGSLSRNTNLLRNFLFLSFCLFLPLTSFLSADSDSILNINQIAKNTERISVKLPSDHSNLATTSISYTNAMSDGTPAPKLVYTESGEYFLAYNDTNSNGRILSLDSKFKMIREILSLKSYRIEDILADSSGITVLLSAFDLEKKGNYESRNFHSAFINQYTTSGKLNFSTKIVGTKEYKKVGDQGIDTTFGTLTLAKTADDRYATYFSTYRKWDDGVTHQSEYLALFDHSGKRMMRPDGKSQEGFTWNVSHSFRPRFVNDGKQLVMVTVGDAYPRGLVVDSFPSKKRELPIVVPKAGPGETYQYVPISTGDLYAKDGTTWITFDSNLDQSSYDIGLLIKSNDVLSKPIYLTNTTKQRERIPRIVPFGKDHLFVMWMTDVGTEKDKWFPKIDKMSLEACLIQKDGTIVTKPQNFGSGQGLSFRSAARFFNLADGRFGWVNDLTGLADQLEIVLISPLKKESNIVSPNETFEPQPTNVKIDPTLGKPMIAAIYEGNEKEVISLLNQGADPNALYEGWSALLYAAYFGRTDSVKALISHKVNTEFSVDGWNALQLSEVRGHGEIVTLLKPLTKAFSRSISKSPNPKNPLRMHIKDRNLRSQIEPLDFNQNLKNLGIPKN
ncbi:ankyrin repeat domain-containing protein [Leptospira abararensis]|uniref:ankyrin repeat domain-containing protein n=1 Tax=Leptospira abararensis TaxID=2810036 RepID=UPI001E48EE4D|nr:ankyrin repeat domain-containing protein [Leptospira abararensis]